MIEEMLAFDGLRILAISYNGIMVRDGAVLVRKMLEKSRCLYVADEASAFKTPAAKVTKRVLASAKYATYRRLLNGTPGEDSPFEVYSQLKWVDPNVWASIGVHNNACFKAMFGVWEQRRRKDGREFPQLIQHRNMDLLSRALYSVGSRVVKEDVLPDLPAKSYTKIYFELSPPQKKAYQDLKKDFYLEMAGKGETTAELPIVRLVRFQQITSNFIPLDSDDDERELVWISPKNPRLDALAQALDNVRGQAVVWAKYTKEIDMISEMLASRNISHRIYDGRTSDEDRIEHRQNFQKGLFQVFLAKQTAAGKGLTLTAADTVVYFSNLFSADWRKQSEDRVHRIGQKRAVRYIDLIAQDTVDTHILAVLRRKRELSNILTKDTLQDWI
jgi:SNF2 family DNA or RNA helicase